MSNQTEATVTGNDISSIGDLKRWLELNDLPDEAPVSVVGFTSSHANGKCDFDRTLFDIKTDEYGNVEIDIGGV